MVFGAHRDFHSGVLPIFTSIDERLTRYEHETFHSPSLSWNRDLPAVFVLIVVLFICSLVFTQVLLLNRAKPNNRTIDARNLTRELRQMDQTIENILKKNAATINQWKNVFQVQTFSNRFENLFQQNFDENSTINEEKNLCDEVPTNLQGRILHENETFPYLTMEKVEQSFPEVERGGRWSPPHCLARHHVAIIIPYRDRFHQLATLLYYLHHILQRQELKYQIFVTEQWGNGTYNKGVLMNAAFIYASTRIPFQCFVFHDVDLIPEDDRNMYSCPQYPRHMSVAIDEMNYELLYEELIGGVLNMPREHFLRVNGYSNLYWGWGAEDDDLYFRIKKSKIKLVRPPVSIARYRMLRHTKRKPARWPKRSKLLRAGTKRYQWDGLSSVQYNLMSVYDYRLFTHLFIDVGSPPPGFN